MRLPIASHRDRSVDGTGQAHANQLSQRVTSCGAPGRRRPHLPRRWPHGFPARGLPQWDALAPHGLHEGVEGREVADYDVRRHGEDLRQAAALRPPPRERGAQTRERRETQAPATPRSAAPETRQGECCDEVSSAVPQKSSWLLNLNNRPPIIWIGCSHWFPYRVVTFRMALELKRL